MLNIGWFHFTMAAAGASGDDPYLLLTDLAIGVFAACIGGVIAARLRLPIITGYLLAGIVIGPFTPGPVSNTARIQTLAELGVAFLMFALGLEFSLEELNKVRRGAVGGGLLQIVLTIALGVPLGLLLGLSLPSSLYLGGVIAVSSSIVILKLLLSRAELDSPQGRLALGIGVVQDISVVVLIVVLPIIGTISDKTDVGALFLELGKALATAVLFLGGSYAVGMRVIPFVLHRLKVLDQRELFLLAILAIAIGLGLLAQTFGVSFALGAFLAGIIVNEWDESHSALHEIEPFRDVFASLFFVFIGMLINPLQVWQYLGDILLVVAAIVIGKTVIVGLVLWLLRYPPLSAFMAGLLLAEVGEFSFILAQRGVAVGAIDARVEAIILSSALITIVATPLLYQILSKILTRTCIGQGKIATPVID